MYIIKLKRPLGLNNVINLHLFRNFKNLGIESGTTFDINNLHDLCIPPIREIEISVLHIGFKNITVKFKLYTYFLISN